MSITSPLLKELKGHILALTRPPEAHPSYSLPPSLTTEPASPSRPRPPVGSQGTSQGGHTSHLPAPVHPAAPNCPSVGADEVCSQQQHERGTFLGGNGPPQMFPSASDHQRTLISTPPDGKEPGAPQLTDPGLFVCSTTPTSTPLIPYGKSLHEQSLLSDQDIICCPPSDETVSSFLNDESASLEYSCRGLLTPTTQGDLSRQFNAISCSDSSGYAPSDGHYDSEHNYPHISSSVRNLSSEGVANPPASNTPVNCQLQQSPFRCSSLNQSSPVAQSLPLQLSPSAAKSSLTTQPPPSRATQDLSGPASHRAVFPRVQDSHPSLEPLCSTLEEILLDGLQGGQHTPFGYTKYTYWDWMRDLRDKAGAEYREQVERVATCKGVRGGLGRGRQLLRQLLAHGCLQAPVLCQVKHRDLTTARYSSTSILAHEILSEIFLSLVRQIDLIKFDLDLDNCHFLEESWELPLVRRAVLNTRLELGLHLAHSQGRCLVLRVDGGGAAHKAGSVHSGDVITSIDGADTRGCGKTRVAALLRQAADHALPLRITLAQGIDRHGRLYPPLLPLLAAVGADAEDLAERRLNEEGGGPPPPAPTRGSTGGEAGAGGNVGHADGRVFFVGSAEVGCRGDIEFIDVGVAAVLRRLAESEGRHKPVPVIFETGEMGVKVSTPTGKVRMQHSYTEISACGQQQRYPLYFAYIAGDTTCSISQRFTCFVFQATTADECGDILLTLADGFHRTHWAV